MGDIRQIIRQRLIIHWLRISAYLGFLSFMTGDPIFKPKIEQRVNYVFVFCPWQRWDRGAEIHWGMVVWKTREMEHTWSNMYTVYGMRRRRRKFFSHDQKMFPKPRFSGALELRGEGGEGVQRGGPPPLPE